MRSTNCFLLFIILLSGTFVIGNNNQTCGCYMLGTLCNIEGESICNNQTLQCRCHQNVIEENCDKCAEGFYDILSGNGCSTCRCNPLNSLNKTCDVLTGQCLCKAGFGGLRCDQCEPYSYKLNPEKCIKCNCNVHGSKDMQCNATGNCPCLKNVEGTQCDRCKENTYSIEQGCIPCPPCYDFVQSEIRNHTKYLNLLEQIIDEIENNLPLLIQDYKHFQNEIKLLKAKIEKLKLEYENYNNSELSEEALNRLSKEAQDFHDEIVRLIQEINKFSIKELNSSVSVGRQNLKDANNLVAVCEEALKNATTISRNLNRHNKSITKMAETALGKANDIENMAKESYQLSLDITNSCNETCKAEEAFQKQQRELEDELQSIKVQVESTVTGAESMKTYFKGFHESTESLKKEALRLKNEADSLEIPGIDEGYSNMKEIEEDYKTIKETIDDLAQTAAKGKGREESATEYLENVNNKQKNIDDAFEETKDYEKRADLAVAKINDILKSAQGGLKEFENIKQSIKPDLGDVAHIQAQIDAVTSYSEEIKSIFQNMLQVVKDLEKIKLDVSRIMKEVEGNKTITDNLLNEVSVLEKQEEELAKSLVESHSRLKAIKQSLSDYKKYQAEVEHEIKRLQEYILYLSTIPTSKEELDEVEKEIKTMEDMLWSVEYLKKEKEKLAKEVARVKDILESLPIEDNILCESPESESKKNK